MKFVISITFSFSEYDESLYDHHNIQCNECVNEICNLHNIIFAFSFSKYDDMPPVSGIDPNEN